MTESQQDSLALRLPCTLVHPHTLRRLALPVSVVLALIAGWMGTDRWELVLKALNPTSFGIPPLLPAGLRMATASS